MADNKEGLNGTEGAKTSTDPQENEIDSNVFAGGFRKLFGSNNHEAAQTPLGKDGEEKTIDEHQDPANK